MDAINASILASVVVATSALLLAAPAMAHPPGLSTQRSHQARVVYAPQLGVEVGLPRDGDYARGIRADLEQRYDDSYRLFRRAQRRYRALLRSRPHQRHLRSWILKASFQQRQSLRLRAPQLTFHPFNTAASAYEGAAARHQKWLSIRAFTGKSPAALGRRVVRGYERAMRLGAGFSENRARLGLATMLCHLGQRRRGLAVFARRRRPLHGWLALPLARFYAACGNQEKALERLRDALRLSPSLRRRVAVSNDFDQLRARPGFWRLIGGNASLSHLDP